MLLLQRHLSLPSHVFHTDEMFSNAMFSRERCNQEGANRTRQRASRGGGAGIVEGVALEDTSLPSLSSTLMSVQKIYAITARGTREYVRGEMAERAPAP